MQQEVIYDRVYGFTTKYILERISVLCVLFTWCGETYDGDSFTINLN